MDVGNNICLYAECLQILSLHGHCPISQPATERIGLAYFHTYWCIFSESFIYTQERLIFCKGNWYFSSYILMVEVICRWSWLILGITMDDKDLDPAGVPAYLCQINRPKMTIIGQNFAPKQKFNTKGLKVSELDGK